MLNNSATTNAATTTATCSMVEEEVVEEPADVSIVMALEVNLLVFPC